MQMSASVTRRGDGHLWLTALGLSLLLNLSLLAVVGMAVLETAKFRKNQPPPAPLPAETVATIIAVPAASRPAPAAPAVPEKKRFARTSADQAAAAPERAAFIGERATRAASDLSPVENAPPLPSQAGIKPRDEDDIETTESDYQDGSLTSEPTVSRPLAAPPSPPAPELSQESAKPTPAAMPDAPGPDEIRSTPPPREKLATGPNPVDIQVPRDAKPDGEIKPTPEQRPAAQSPPPRPAADAPKPLAASAPPAKPAFKGFQRKTAVTGSISRSGRSALDVEDSPLGRYQAAISRAVEREWQRNCVRHRDFITPGFLTVRFFVETSGKVRSVQFVGEMETGEVQKGFTLNSIRDAEIPPMPRPLRAEYDDEPLELVFRFYF